MEADVTSWEIAAMSPTVIHLVHAAAVQDTRTKRGRRA
jgi:hypothetical protein